MITNETVRPHIDRLIALHGQRDRVSAEIRDVYNAAKLDGLDKTALGAAVRFLREPKARASFSAHLSLVDEYLTAYEAPDSHAHARVRELSVLIDQVQQDMDASA